MLGILSIDRRSPNMPGQVAVFNQLAGILTGEASPGKTQVSTESCECEVEEVVLLL